MKADTTSTPLSASDPLGGVALATAATPPHPRATAAAVVDKDRLRELLRALSRGLVERDDAVRLALLAAMAGEHLLLLGPPGTAKSLVARRLRDAFADASYFEHLMTRFTVPEEIFGPFSIKGLQEDRYERQIDRYLPTASVAFLDEIFKANSAILNSLLTLLNERRFDNGHQRLETPLVSLIGASNELPEGPELHALYDRFLLRLYVAPVSEAGFERLLDTAQADAPAAGHRMRLTVEELGAVRDLVDDVELPAKIKALLKELRAWLAAEQIDVSDRRWLKIVRLLKASALTDGRDQVSIWDAWLLEHCVWSLPEQRERIHDWYASRIGAAAAADPTELRRYVSALEVALKRDEDGRRQAQNADGNLLYMDTGGGMVPDPKPSKQQERDGKPLFLAPPGAVRDYYGEATRDNGGKGYTKDELAQLRVDAGDGRRVAFSDWAKSEKYAASRRNWLTKTVTLPPAMEPARYARTYVTERVAEVDETSRRIATYQRDLDDHLASLFRDVKSHLWIDPALAGPARDNLEQTRTVVGELAKRVADLRERFAQLPVDNGAVS